VSCRRHRFRSLCMCQFLLLTPLAKRCVIIPPIGHSMPLTGNVAPALGMKLKRHDRPP
jgi:hypothetical protein